MFFLPYNKTVPAVLHKKEDMSAGGNERDKLLAEPWQFLSNYQSLISPCTVGEPAPHPSKIFFYFSTVNELTPMYACLLLTKVLLLLLEKVIHSLFVGRQPVLFAVCVMLWEHIPHWLIKASSNGEE